jgi:hypothetical protein
MSKPNEKRKGYCVSARVKGKRVFKVTQTFLRKYIIRSHMIFSENIGSNSDV